MAIASLFVLKALLKYNYFPTQKKDKDELPPCFSAKAFSPKVAKQMLAVPHRKNGLGWDTVAYRATRFTGVPRILSIPHPIAHAYLSIFIAKHWKYLSYTTIGGRSEIRPRQHSDGRLIIMDYEASSTKSRKQHHLSFGRRFRVHTDIASCFPSVYSHSIPWATVGIAHAKANKSNKSAWFNELDEKVRWCKRNETNGIAIGPATSNVIIESILAKVDSDLAAQGFVFVRYIDDYTAYCDTETQAQSFIHCLGVELDKFKLLLNIKKTKIDVLPEPITPAWIPQLALLLPKKKILNVYDVANYLSMAQNIAQSEPDGSVIKYALKTLLRLKLLPTARDFLLGEMLLLAYHYPTVVPLLRKPLRNALSFPPSLQFKDYDQKLNFLLEDHAFHHRSDAICWLLFFLSKMKYAVEDKACQKILESKDCLALLCLHETGSANQKLLVQEFAKGLDKTDLYELDCYWLLIYELFKGNSIKNPYAGYEEAFSVLKTANVSFFNPTSKL